MTPTQNTKGRRRSVLKLLGAAAGATAFGSMASDRTSGSDHDRSFVLEQGDTCVELTPLSGDESVEEFYDYRYPTDAFDSVSGSDGDSFSSEGTTHLQEDATSILFLYDGPEGLSLVVVHGRFEGDDNGGLVTFTFEGMPEDASWVVRDDYYTVEGEPAPTNHDRWDVDGSDQQVDWAYIGGRTDGGAARGLGETFEFSITPAFNTDAVLASDFPDDGPIDAWEALSADGDSPERVSLQMDETVTIRSGACDGTADDEPDDQDGEKDKDGEEDEDDEPDGQDDEPDDQDGEKDKDDEEDVDDDDEEGC